MRLGRQSDRQQCSLLCRRAVRGSLATIEIFVTIVTVGSVALLAGSDITQLDRQKRTLC